MKPLTEQSTTELVRLHNSLVPPTKAVKRFATKAAAIRRVQALLDAKTTSSAPAGKAEPAEADEHAASASSKAAREPRKSTVYVEGGPNGPEQYRSVAAAFRALDLPMGKHQKFRSKLKRSGRETIDRYTFHTNKI